jgi:WS/DGAT/MGAT family acyltransferase
MQQLSGMDAAFIYLETANQPMHIGSLAIYDQSTAPGGRVGFKDILQYFQDRLHKARCLRQRLTRVPLSLDPPYWIEDPDFDLEFHIRHIALPHPGDWRQLCIQAARLHARPLDMNKPLWEFTVIEGLDNVPGVPKGSFALVSKIHHAAIDGVSGGELSAAVHDLTPDATVEPPDRPWLPDHLPTDVELLTRSAMNTVKTPLKLARLIGSATPSVARLANAWVRKQARLNIKVPRTRFNTSVSPHRVFDGVCFDLNEIKAIKQTLEGATVNDVVVTIIAGALRKYLRSKSELPEDSLVAMAPISVRPEKQRKSAGNLVTAMSLPIRTDIENPARRLKAVRDESRQAKNVSSTLGLNLSNQLAEFLPSTISGLLVRAYGRTHLADRLPPIYNTVITNVPGPNVPLYSMGSELVANFGLGPVVHGLGLFQPVLSYNGTLTISAVACREMMPDPAFYCECLQLSFDELKMAVSDTTPKPATRKRRLKKKKPGSKKT